MDRHAIRHQRHTYRHICRCAGAGWSLREPTDRGWFASVRCGCRNYGGLSNGLVSVGSGPASDGSGDTGLAAGPDQAGQHVYIPTIGWADSSPAVQACCLARISGLASSSGCCVLLLFPLTSSSGGGYVPALGEQKNLERNSRFCLTELGRCYTPRLIWVRERVNISSHLFLL